MRKLTANQQSVMECLGSEWLQLKEISVLFYKKSFAKQNRNQTHSDELGGYVIKSTTSRVLSSLVKNGLVDYEYQGKYKLKNKPE